MMRLTATTIPKTVQNAFFIVCSSFYNFGND
jgi:hypothetical protein